VHFGQIFLIFAEFCRIFQKPTGSVTSDFPCSADFLNTSMEPPGEVEHGVAVCHHLLDEMREQANPSLRNSLDEIEQRCH
jgi:hypothetical protein